MREIIGELWDYWGTFGYCTTCYGPYKNGETPYCAQRHIAIESEIADAKFICCITTNGTVKANGEAVMGRGCAAEAKARIPGLARSLGNYLKEHGNRVMAHATRGAGGIFYHPQLVFFPVKHQWFEHADLALIRRSAEQLSDMVTGTDYVAVLPRPGCGNGHLRWEDVKPVIAPILPDNIWVISRT